MRKNTPPIPFLWVDISAEADYRSCLSISWCRSRSSRFRWFAFEALASETKEGREKRNYGQLADEFVGEWNKKRIEKKERKLQI